MPSLPTRGSRPASGTVRTVLTLLVVTALTWGVAFLVRQPTGSRWQLRLAGVAAYGGLFVLFLVGAWLVSGLARRRAAVVILLGAVALQIASASSPPRTSDDLYRYVWDGKVQAAGIDPYRYVPAAPELVGLRDPSLWPVDGSGHCVAAAPHVAAGCTLLNRPTVHTIYPPVAEGYFTLVHAVVPGAGRGLFGIGGLFGGVSGASAIQGAAATLAVAVTVLLLFGLRRLGRDPRYAVLWAWCPTVALEAGNGGHVDVLAVFLTGIALLLLARGSVGRGGVLLGLAIATKVTPALAVPGALRRRPLLFLTSLTGPILLVYLPHVVAVRSGVFGFFSGYLKEEGYDSGQRFAVLDKLLPGPAVQPAAFLILAAVAFLVWRRAQPETPWRGALAMTTAAMLIAAPSYPWYAMLLLLFVAFEGWRAAPLVAVAFGGYVVQLDIRPGWGYGFATVVVGVAFGAPVVARWRRSSASAVSTAHAAPAPSASDRSDWSDQSIPTIDVILPCLDEEAALPYVLSRMPAGYRAIVVDNGSTDASAAVAERLGALVVHEPRRGFGAACHAGLLAATAEVVCFLDCDGSFDPQDLLKVTAPVLDGRADLALGQRRPLSRGAWPPHARLANRLLARRIRRETGVVVHDLGPMRAMARERLIALDVRDRRFGYPLEMVLKAAAGGWRVVEVDVPYAPRTGKSKVTGTVGGTVKAVRDMRRVWRAATQ